MSNESEQLTPFERQVLQLIVDGTSNEALTLQQQVDVATVSDRTAGSGAGVWLEVPDYATRLSPPIGRDIANLSGVIQGRDGRELSVFFILHVRDGAVHSLECISQGPWPAHPQLKSFGYSQRGRNGLIL